MYFYFSMLNPILQAWIAGLFTFFITCLGSSLVFFFRKTKRVFLDGMLSISSGIMISASFFSLLEPGIEISNELHFKTWLVIIFGFLFGGFFLLFFDKVIDFISKKKESSSIYSIRRSILLFFSIALHNIPEGLVIGVAFGAVGFSSHSTSLLSAITLAIGIAIQNFPEGSAISLPMMQEGISRWKSFLFGSLSAIVEPIFAVVGALLVLKVQILLPFIMSFTASAMIFVVVKELIPESQSNSNSSLMTGFFLIGFSIMMFLELFLQ